MKKYDISPAAFIVVAVLGLTALWFAFVAGWLYLHGQTEEAKDAALAMGTASAPLAAILARHRNDPSDAPAGTPADPVTVKTAEQPLEVTPAREPSPAGTAGWLTGPDSGHADLLLLLVIITGVFVGGFLLHLALT